VAEIGSAITGAPQLNALGVYLPTYPASLDPNFDPIAIYSELVTGAHQGITDALVDIGVLPPSYFATTYPAVNSVSAVAAV
jgi:hypothetical protein